jgi:hypothetical protein
MYSVASRAEFLEIYKELGRKYDLPVFLNKLLIEEIGLDAKRCLNGNDPVADHLFLGRFHHFENDGLAAYYDHTLDHLPVGFNLLILHPAFDDREMQAITENHPNFGSAWRQIDYDYFTSEKCASKLKENDIKMVTWGEIKIAMKKTL